jgi:hypothetical protein
LEETRYVLNNPEVTEEESEHNYELAQRYYSFTMLEQRLHLLMANCFGEME